VNVEWVSKVVMDKFRNVGNMSAIQIMDDVKKNYNTRISPWITLQAKHKALAELEGDGAKQYSLLFDYIAELKRVGRETTCKIKLSELIPTFSQRFESFYMCLDGCKKGFLPSCRPFIADDGCHLKTKYGGQLLVAIGKDPNDQYFPLAFAVVENECKETWRWFLTLLLDDIGDMHTNRWVFISNQQKV